MQFGTEPLSGGAKRFFICSLKYQQNFAQKVQFCSVLTHLEIWPISVNLMFKQQQKVKYQFLASLLLGKVKVAKLKSLSRYRMVQIHIDIYYVCVTCSTIVLSEIHYPFFPMKKRTNWCGYKFLSYIFFTL